MTTLRSTSGSKAVNIRFNEFNAYRASAVQIYNGEESVIEARSFPTQKKAIQWAKRILA